jgi:hypothetical protein
MMSGHRKRCGCCRKEIYFLPLPEIETWSPRPYPISVLAENPTSFVSVCTDKKWMHGTRRDDGNTGYKCTSVVWQLFAINEILWYFHSTYWKLLCSYIYYMLFYRDKLNSLNVPSTDFTLAFHLAMSEFSSLRSVALFCTYLLFVMMLQTPLRQVRVCTALLKLDNRCTWCNQAIVFLSWHNETRINIKIINLLFRKQ